MPKSIGMLCLDGLSKGVLQSGSDFLDQMRVHQRRMDPRAQVQHAPRSIPAGDRVEILNNHVAHLKILPVIV